MTFDNKQRPLPGTVALVGSGEYLPVMNETDTYLLETVGGVKTARVALLPTASGLERKGPSSWNALGMKHFTQLGVTDVRATNIIDRDSANDPAQVALLDGVDFFYFSGGDPQHTINSLRDSLAWSSIKAAYERGAVLAGCSAGAMMLGGATASIRKALIGGKVEFIAAIGIVPHLIVFPHFDRMIGFASQKRFQQLSQTAPTGTTIVGIDEDTALVRIVSHVDGSEKDRWRVMGRRTVKVFAGDAQKHELKSGDEVVL